MKIGLCARLKTPADGVLEDAERDATEVAVSEILIIIGRDVREVVRREVHREGLIQVGELFDTAAEAVLLAGERAALGSCCCGRCSRTPM